MMDVQALEVVKSLLFVVLAGCSDGHAGWPFELGTGMAVMTPQESEFVGLGKNCGNIIHTLL